MLPVLVVLESVLDVSFVLLIDGHLTSARPVKPVVTGGEDVVDDAEVVVEGVGLRLHQYW